jgi:hypothetical protein
MDAEPSLEIRRPERPADPELLEHLRGALEGCPDVAFAYLPEVYVPGQQPRPEVVLFVWLRRHAVRSVRAALNAVSARIAEALPDGDYMDVVILNSAPDLLVAVEAADCLVVERDPEERRQALEAARSSDHAPEAPTRPWWWPFG